MQELLHSIVNIRFLYLISTKIAIVEIKEFFVMSLKQLLHEKRQEIINIADKHGAFNVRLFGSVARDEDTENSDIDLLIDYDLAKISSWFPTGLKQDLEELLGRKIDVVTTKSLHYFLRDQIINEAIEL